MRISVYIASTLDGFIAREDGALDWLTANAAGPSEEDYGYRAFFESVDVLVMGRNTFDVVRSFGEWPYGDKPTVVLTRRPIEFPGELSATVSAMAGSPEDVVTRLDERGAAHVYLDGGRTVQEFLAAGLVHRLIITRIPVLIGVGIPLFGPVPGDVRLRHVATRSFASGLIQSEYAIQKEDGAPPTKHLSG